MPAVVRRFSCQAELLRLDPAVRENVEVGLERLRVRFLNEYGRTLRDDSRLAFNACCGQLPTTEDEVLAEMATIQWLSESTPYQPLCELVLRKIANRAHERYGIKDWKALWEVVRAHGPELLKLHLIERAGGIPELRLHPPPGGCAPPPPTNQDYPAV